jgi:hypothetical protein
MIVQMWSSELRHHEVLHVDTISEELAFFLRLQVQSHIIVSAQETTN